MPQLEYIYVYQTHTLFNVLFSYMSSPRGLLNLSHQQVWSHTSCSSFTLGTCDLAVTNDGHLHGKSCQRAILWLLQAAPGVEREHLQGAVQRVPGILCHVHCHQPHVQVRQQLQRTFAEKDQCFVLQIIFLYYFAVLDFSSMMTRRGILKNWQFIAITMPVSSPCPLCWVSFSGVLVKFEITEEGTGFT